jgi:hypothetical protein
MKEDSLTAVFSRLRPNAWPLKDIKSLPAQNHPTVALQDRSIERLMKESRLLVKFSKSRESVLRRP